jgi:sugar phosphate isomerase/epimerase
MVKIWFFCEHDFMRLGGPVYDWDGDCEKWIASTKKENYSAVYSPVGFDAKKGMPSDLEIGKYAEAARKADIVIAEVGAWSNPIDPDPVKAAEALQKCQGSLALAEQIGARCCVNVVGSKSPTQWAGPHHSNFSQETFEEVVECTRKIVDAVRPKRTFYCLETMPWIFPSGPGQYLDLIKAIDRPSVAVHLDPVNMVNSPERVYDTASLIRECFAKLGHLIKSCHGKDILLHENLTLHLDECRPGNGVLDYGIFLKELSKLDPDTPLMLEHLPREEYPPAAEYVRKIAAEQQLKFI